VFWWTRARLGSPTSLHKKRVCPSKNEPQQQGISYLERGRERVREIKWWGSKSSIFKVMLGLGERGEKELTIKILSKIINNSYLSKC
jgi:hypothetical protein